jgi:fructosamine-3-kinase
MALQGSLLEQIGHRLTDILGQPVDVEQTMSIGGGSINDAWRIDTNEGRFFLKTNSADRYPSMFEAEAGGLELLRSTDTLPIPRVFAWGEDHDTTWLLLEWLEGNERKDGFWRRSGERLAKLHRNSNDQFGLERDNYIGSLKQRNQQETEWSQFFIHHRLEPMLKLARDKRRVEAGMSFRFERLFSRLDELFPKEPVALLHGDLWNGNFMTGPDGQAWVMDPAVYYGHREMDIAMSRLFGGFEPEFYSGYNDEWPLEKGWEERVDLCNLYPLLVHVNLFGGGYVAQVESILARYV